MAATNFTAFTDPHDSNFRTFSLRVNSDIRARFNATLEKHQNSSGFRFAL